MTFPLEQEAQGEVSHCSLSAHVTLFLGSTWKGKINRCIMKYQGNRDPQKMEGKDSNLTVIHGRDCETLNLSRIKACSPFFHKEPPSSMFHGSGHWDPITMNAIMSVYEGSAQLFTLRPSGAWLGPSICLTIYRSLLRPLSPGQSTLDASSRCVSRDVF